MRCMPKKAAVKRTDAQVVNQGVAQTKGLDLFADSVHQERLWKTRVAGLVQISVWYQL